MYRPGRKMISNSNFFPYNFCVFVRLELFHGPSVDPFTFRILTAMKPLHALKINEHSIAAN